MTASTARPASVDEVRSDLLARLGLDDTISPEELVAAHEAVERFLASAPRQLGAWARRQASVADEAYALLTDPAALARTVALGGDATRRATAPGGPATPPVRQEPVSHSTPSAPTRGRRHHDASPTVDAEPSDEELAELVASVTPSAHRDSVGKRSPARTAKAARGAPVGAGIELGRPNLRRRLMLAAGGVALVALVAFAGYRFGGGGGTASLPATSPSASPTIDLAAVNAYMGRIASNPKDVEALQGLADLYYGAGDYASATDFLDRILAVDPSNVRALLGLGAAAFNSGDQASAETAWKKVVSIDPKSVEAHYDLGFLYLNVNDLAAVKREWQLVVQLDPGSDVARNVRAHLDALAAQAAASGSPSGAPVASSSAAPSAAPTASAIP
jgi:cytochrome c-type biogenesis protein CcmH/NrfG